MARNDAKIEGKNFGKETEKIRVFVVKSNYFNLDLINFSETFRLIFFPSFKAFE